MPAPRPYSYEPRKIDLRELGVPVCEHMFEYSQMKSGCFYSIHDTWDDKEELKKASKFLFEDCRPRVLGARMARYGDPPDLLEVALR